jgi:NtrC-family two-component system response regulator AlgB
MRLGMGWGVTGRMDPLQPGDWSALVVDDDAGIRQSLRLCLETGGGRAFGVATASGALEALERSSFEVVLLDLWLGAESGLDLIPEILKRRPGAAIIVVTAFATLETAVQAMRIGAVDYLPKPFTPEQVRRSVRRVVEVGVLPSKEAAGPAGSPALIAFDWQGMAHRAFVTRAERVADADCAVLLRGESGSGKNVFARFLHDKSQRRAAPFVTVHCPALQGDLWASLLFGHRKGAFTGAFADALGKVQEAEGGTLFLDEVGDLGADAQARLLRFLNDRTFERVGEACERHADVRLIAATNRDLESRVEQGCFREDLLYRLDVVSLAVPPLRARRDDVLPLARHYLSIFAARRNRPAELSRSAEQALLAHDWPGNLRELRNAIERATILGAARVLEPEDLGLPEPEVLGAKGTTRGRVGLAVGDDISLETLEREHIACVIARGTSLESAARTLGIDATTLQRKRKRYGLA